MRFNDKRGFTLIEVIVVAGIIAILAGILVPMIFNQIDEAKVTRALGDMKSIQSGIMIFKKDTGSWPDKTAPGVVGVTLLYSDSKSTATPPIPTNSGIDWNSTTAERIADHLNANNDGVYGATTWKGPYLNANDADPWGNAYIINADNFSTDGKVWVVSAGPDGIIQTNAASDSCSDKAAGNGDDICIRLK
ncbi:MAG: type II secretion system protein GspG [Verrucomicrobia bacterium]|nr:type II secretion system protein GspG [Deltaproteobacteria bacterium]